MGTFTAELTFGQYQYGTMAETPGISFKTILALGGSVYASFAFALDYKNGEPWVAGVKYANFFPALPGSTYVRSGAKGERNALTTGDVIDDFAANVPGIVPGVGYYSRSALQNLLLQSQTLDNASWSKSALAVTSNTQVAPDGTTTADTLTTGGTAVAQYVFQADGIASGVTTYSCVLKAGTGRFVQLAHNQISTTFANFDLVSGVVGTVGAGLTSAHIIDYGGGWYRCVIVLTVGAASSLAIIPVIASTSGYLAAYTAVVETIHAWQAQSIAGNFPDGGPIIVTGAGTASTGADVLAASATLPDEDYFLWAVATLKSSATDYDVLVDLSDGTAANNIYLARNTAGNTEIQSTSATVATVVGPGTSISAGGRVVMGLRRKSGKLTGCVRVASVTTLGTESVTIIANPVGITTVRPGVYVTGSSQADGVIEGVFRRAGTFSDADITAILGAA